MTVAESLTLQGESVGSNYAGILGPLAMTLMIVRGIVNATGVESVLWASAFAMAVMAGVGYVLGELAAWIVEDSVRTKVAAEIAHIEAKRIAKRVK